MISGYDIAYGAALAVTSPLWLIHGRSRRKVLRALRERRGVASLRHGDAPAVLIHAVSLGEINATRAMVRMLSAACPDLHFVVTTTTDTGFARARELYGDDPRATVLRYPLDLSRWVGRMLDAVRPSVAVLMELEVWPNFMRQCRRRGISVILVNGRLTQESFRRYLLAGPLTRRMFRRLAAVCAQEQTYADRFVSLGVPCDRIQMTGTMKFDTAQITDRTAGTEDLAGAVGLNAGPGPVWVCGSTGPGEEQVLLDVYTQLLAEFPSLRLVLVPRKPERFDDVEALIRASSNKVIRRSAPHAAEAAETLQAPCSPPVILGDTMGELRKFYCLADVVFVGRTLLDLGSRQHGSDMIEPAALAKPVIVGPYTGNFAEVMSRFREADAIREVRRPDELLIEVRSLLSDRAAAQSLGRRAQEVVGREQGATERNVQVILEQLERVRPAREAPVASGGPGIRASKNTY